MTLSRKQTGLTQQDFISIGSIVNIKGRTSTHSVKAISKDRCNAYISWKNNFCWWPMTELVFVSQMDLVI